MRVCFNATFSNISAISWRPVLVVEEDGKNQRPQYKCISHTETMYVYSILITLFQTKSGIMRSNCDTLNVILYYDTVCIYTCSI